MLLLTLHGQYVVYAIYHMLTETAVLHDHMLLAMIYLHDWQQNILDTLFW